VERWFQNTRGLVIVILAIATCALLLATEPDDGFPTGVTSSSNGGSETVTPPSTTQPVVTTTTFARPTLQEGTGDTANTMVVQERLNAHGFDVGTPDGDFGPGTKAQVIAFQTAKGISPADGVVNQATWTALLAEPSTTTTPAPTTKP
jgi:peptidoglycan hydrolase-like protein with peptidoglycan-binding domain